jgi:hypothetical protein
MKKTKGFVPVFCGLGMFAFGVAGAVLPMAKGLKEEVLVNGTSMGSSEWTGFQMIWGQVENDNQSSLPVVGGTLAAWILLLVAVLASLVFFFWKNKNAKFVLALGALCAIVGGILFFFSKNLIGVSDSTGTLFGITGQTKYTLETGLLLPAIFGCVSGASGLVGSILEK